MSGKLKAAASLLCALFLFCVPPLVAQGPAFCACAHTRDDVDDLARVAQHQASAADETTRHLEDARSNLARAGTRMAGGDAAPRDVIEHAREELAAADRSFAALVDVPPADEADRAHVAALARRYQVLRRALGALVQDLDARDLRAFFDQPTQSYLDAWVAELRGFAQFSAAASRDASGLNEWHDWRDAIHVRMTFLRTAGAFFLVALVALAGLAMSVAPRARAPYCACRVRGSDRQREISR